MKLVKFLLVIAILFITAMYYNIYSFDRGLVKDTEDADISLIFTIKDMESVKIGDEYYVFYLTDDAAYVEDVDEDDYKAFSALFDVKEKSIIPGVAAVGASLAILLFVKGKRS